MQKLDVYLNNPFRFGFRIKRSFIDGNIFFIKQVIKNIGLKILKITPM